MTIALDVRDLLSAPGSSRRASLAECLDGLSTEVARVPEDRPVKADLLLESVVEGVLVSGIVSGDMVLTCARCLKPIEWAFGLEVRELFAPEASVGSDEYPLEEGSIDLDPLIRDAVIPAMPYAPLCRPGCLGLCERCGGDRNVGECSCPPPVDPRWAPLAQVEVRAGRSPAPSARRQGR